MGFFLKMKRSLGVSFDFKKGRVFLRLVFCLLNPLCSIGNYKLIMFIFLLCVKILAERRITAFGLLQPMPKVSSKVFV